MKIGDQRGFTLIELMIVVAIIGILAAIAIPNFIRYQLKSKTTEARTNLGGIKTSFESFRAENDNYATSPGEPGAVSGTVKTSWPATPCPAGCDRTIAGILLCAAFDCTGFKPAGDVFYTYAAANLPAGPPPGWPCRPTSNQYFGKNQTSGVRCGIEPASVLA